MILTLKVFEEVFIESSFHRFIINNNLENLIKLNNTDRRYVIFSPKKISEELAKRVANFDDEDFDAIRFFLFYEVKVTYRNYRN